MRLRAVVNGGSFPSLPSLEAAERITPSRTERFVSCRQVGTFDSSGVLTALNNGFTLRRFAPCPPRHEFRGGDEHFAEAE